MKSLSDQLGDYIIEIYDKNPSTQVMHIFDLVMPVLQALEDQREDNIEYCGQAGLGTASVDESEVFKQLNALKHALKSPKDWQKIPGGEF